MTPGGNDVLVLHSIPQLSAHALPAYLAMTAGIAIVLIVMRATRGVFLEVDCRYDVRRTRWFAPLRRARPETDLATNVARQDRRWTEALPPRRPAAAVDTRP
jgi:hypothetical protein